MKKSFMRSITFFLSLMMSFVSIPTVSYAYSEADAIYYDVDIDDYIEFDEDDFNDVCLDLMDTELDYIVFELPDWDEGILYYDYNGDDEEEISSYDEFYYDEEPSISDISFVPDEDCPSEITISYEGVDLDGNYFYGDIIIEVSGSSSDTDTYIEYSVYVDDTVTFDEDDFNDYCQEENNEDLDYVKFTLPSSSKGILYYDYDGDDEEEISSSDKFYYDGEPSISDITFVPDEDCPSEITISYEGVDVEGDYFYGDIIIEVSGTSSNTDTYIEYSAYESGTVIFDEDDFNDYCQEENNEDLDYIKFTLPSSSKGILYYDYDGDDEEKISSTDKFYYGGEPSISDITFVPDEDFTGDCEISFSGYDEDGDSIQGTVLISIKKNTQSYSADTISFTGYAGYKISFISSYFNDKCKSLTGSALDYVHFTVPDASEGTLYYGYASENSYSSLVTEDTDYYYTETFPYLSDVSFVSASGNTSGTSSISYTGYGIDGSSFTGSISITYTALSGFTNITSESKSSQYFKDVGESYSWAANYIDTLYENGIVSGEVSSDGTRMFKPSNSITRGDFLLMLSKAFNLEITETSDNFSDVSEGSYYYNAIAAAKALGIAQGYNNNFYPQAAITREDAMVLALRAMELTGMQVTAGSLTELAVYTDYGLISGYAQEAIASLVKDGIITGSNNNINPKNNITRAEAAVIFHKIKY